MVNVLIVDDNLHYAMSLMNFINKKNTNIRVSHISADGNDAINIINNDNNINVILLDLELPKLNGNIVLEKIKNKNRYYKSIIVISGNFDLIRKIKDTNMIFSIISKTIDNNTLINKINELIECREKDIKKQKIIDELLFLGYDFSYKGTRYLVDVIEYIYMNQDKNIDVLERCVYPEIAKGYGTSVHNIKCNINRATNEMYCEADFSKIEKYLKMEKDVKPKLKTIINIIINKIC